MNKMIMKKGFTLIELLVVIAIIGILAALIIVSLTGARAKATDTQLKNNARNIDTALAQFYLDQTPEAYPIELTAGGAEVGASLTTDLDDYLTGTTAFTHSGVNAKYISAAAGASYAQAWGLKTGTEAATTSGNGVYDVIANNVTAGNALVLTAMNATTGGAFASTKAFVTYGPQ